MKNLNLQQQKFQNLKVLNQEGQKKDKGLF